MSTIYSLPLTNILVNGTRTYRIRTRDYDAILQHVEVSSKTNETINLDFTDLYFTSISFASNSDLGETTLKCIRETKDIKNYYAVDSRPITCDESLKDEYLPELQFLVMRGYVIDIPVPIFKDITLDLNHQWRRCQNYQSPLEGWTLYESASNWHVSYGYAYCYLNIVSNDAPLVIYYCSYAEAQFDWLKIEFPDATMVDTLRIPQQPPTSLDRMSIIEKDATMTGLCTIAYFKDSSGDSGDDRAYILLPNDIPFINEYEEQPPVPEPIHIQNITISGPNQITAPGVYNYYASITPSDADEYDIDWSFVGSFSEPHLSMQTDPDDPFHCQLIVSTPESSFSAAFAIECEDNVSRNYDRFSVAVDIYVEPPVPADGPLCFTAHSSDVVVTIPLAALTNPMISTDGVNWSAAPATYTIPANESVYMKADSCNSGIATNTQFKFSETVDASGNIMSLTGNINKLNMTGNSFNSLFRSCRTLKTAPKLPATTLIDHCYEGMFYECSSLTTVPELPADTLASFCYSVMFHRCTSLTTAPELPATTLASFCYDGMFYGCSSLTTAPELPATTLTTECYDSMFYECSSLTTAPELPATELADSCYAYMFYGTALTTAPELPATTLANNCYKAMFVGCSSLTTAPELPATTLTSSCYEGMFQNCSSLTTAPELPATTLTTKCYDGMFQRCTSLTSAPELPATTLVSNCYQYMFNGCTSLNYIKVGATAWRTSYVTNWVYSVSSTGTFYKKTGVNVPEGMNGIPSGWTVVEY